MRAIRLVSLAALVWSSCGDDTGSSATGPDANVADAPAPADAAVPDAPPGLAHGAACGMLPDGGDIAGECMTGDLCCAPTQFDQSVCASPAPPNDAGIGLGQCPLPDLMVDHDRLANELGVGMTNFSASGCSVQEGCASGSGLRRLLHFTVTTPNVGTADLYLGNPAQHPGLFQFSQCHNHYHFNGYARYQIFDASNNLVLEGRKRAFCLEDYERQTDPPLGGRQNAHYNCSNQGISMGWQDSYVNGLTCQFMDITDLPPGHYTLKVTINPDRLLTELRYDNNEGQVEFDLGPAPASATDPCNGTLPAGVVTGTDRECGWQNGGTFTCTAGQQVRVGCSATCGNLGSCTGDTMIRICDGSGPCSATAAVGANDDCSQTDTCSLATFNCPSSGQYTVLWGPYDTSQTATCNIAHNP